MPLQPEQLNTGDTSQFLFAIEDAIRTHEHDGNEAKQININDLFGSVLQLQKTLEFIDEHNIQFGTTTGTKIGTATTEKLAFYDATPVDQPDALTAQDTSITHTAPGTPDFAIQDLTNSSAYGFVTKDEGNTVLQVILNLQVRLAEVEARLEELGLVATN